MNKFDNLDELCLRAEDIPSRQVETPALRRRQARRQTEFITVPLSWALALAKTKRRATSMLALYVLHRAWRYKGEPVTLSNTALEEWGVSRNEKRHALAELEALGLISVDRTNRKAPA